MFWDSLLALRQVFFEHVAVQALVRDLQVGKFLIDRRLENRPRLFCRSWVAWTYGYGSYLYIEWHPPLHRDDVRLSHSFDLAAAFDFPAVRMLYFYLRMDLKVMFDLELC